MTSLHLALVGHGIWGRNLLRDLLGLGHTVTVIEPAPLAAEAARAAGATAVFASPEQLPAVDGIIVATPASTHAAVVTALAARGVPILCEKPLTTDLAEARDLVARFGARLFVGHIWCYHPGVEALAAIARDGELGPVHGLRTTRTNWTSPRADVDSTWNLAPHDIALAQFILGHIPAPRFAHAELLAGRCVGLLAILGEPSPASGASAPATPWAVFEVSNRHREKRREVRLHCRDGVAVLPDADTGHIEITRTGPDGKPVLETRPVSTESALHRELAAFCAHLSGGPAPATNAAQGLAVVACLTTLRQLAGLDAPANTHAAR